VNETKVLKLSEVCRVYQPETISKKSLPANGTYPVYGANGKIGFSDKYNHEDPQLLLGCRGSVGSIHISEPFSWINGNAMVVQHFETIITRDYLKYSLSGGINIKSAISGTAQPQITRASLSPIQIPVPPLQKQGEIVEKLDSAFAAIDLAKLENRRSIQSLSNLLDSKFDDFFMRINEKYGMVQSGEVIDVRDGTHDSPSYVDSGYPLITSKNLQDGLIDFSKVSFIKEADYQQINKRSRVEVGDLLFAMIGTIGNPVVVKEDPLFAIKNVALFKGNTKYDMTFLRHYLRTPRIKEKFEREAKGTTQRFLGLGYLRTLDIPNVPIEDQLEMVIQLDQFEGEVKNLEINLKLRLENLITLNNSILSLAFLNEIEQEAV
jgi:type I restriction enzyme S subunit